MFIIGIIIAFVLFSIIVIIHEWGHFITARIFGVKVEEFGLGIPPRAKKLFTDKKGTLFSLNWLPLGGFVRLSGEHIEKFFVYDENKKLYNSKALEKAIIANKDIYDKHGEVISVLEKEGILKQLQEHKAKYNFVNIAYWKQAIVILAGVFMNFILAFFIFFILFLVGVKPIGINDKIQTSLEVKLIPTFKQARDAGILQVGKGILTQPIPGSRAEKSGLAPGDIITQVNNTKINTIEGFIQELQKNKNKDIQLSGYRKNPKYKKGCKCKEKYAFTKTISIPESGKIGTYVGENIVINQDFVYKFGVGDATKYAFLETKNQISLTFHGLSYLAKKVFTPKNEAERKEAISQVSGPIGLVNFISNSISAGVIFLVIIAAIISINLGVFNLLPIPALDGGRFIFIVISGVLEKLFGKKILNGNIEGIIHLLFFIILIALSIFIGYNDVIKIINK